MVNIMVNIMVNMANINSLDWQLWLHVVLGPAALWLGSVAPRLEAVGEHHGVEVGHVVLVAARVVVGNPADVGEIGGLGQLRSAPVDA